MPLWGGMLPAKDKDYSQLLHRICGDVNIIRKNKKAT
jgi:hypothetical protein